MTLRRLQARLFLAAWPLIVGAILVVALFSTRSAHVQLAEFEARLHTPVASHTLLAIASDVAQMWPALRGPAGEAQLRTAAERLRDSSSVIVLDTTGALVASSAHDIVQADLQLTRDGSLEVTRTSSVGNERRLQRLIVNGIALTGTDGRKLGSLYLLPRAMSPPPTARTMVNGIQRTLWLAVIIVTALSALGAWWLAYPVVAQVRRLTDAARLVKSNALATRVTVSSRDELGELERSFNDMAQSLDQTEHAKRQLISDLAHELRTPLTNVIGLLEAMRDGLRAPDVTTLHSAQEEALLLKRLVDELQELALADAGTLHFECDDIDIDSQVRHACDAFQTLAPAPRVVSPVRRSIARADPRRLAQVLRNVLQNAITHTPADGSVTATVDADEECVRIMIADTGRGIPAAQLPLIFDRFYRVDASRDRATGGMGLGLALSRRMVEQMGGSIAAESEDGRGTRITIRLARTSQSAPRT